MFGGYANKAALSRRRASSGWNSLFQDRPKAVPSSKLEQLEQLEHAWNGKSLFPGSAPFWQRMKVRVNSLSGRQAGPLFIARGSCVDGQGSCGTQD